MVLEKPPKIVLNDDFVDLREDCTSDGACIRNRNKVNSSCNKSKQANLRHELRFEKELINCGLKKLANKYNATKAKYQSTPSPDGKGQGFQREYSMVDPRPRTCERYYITANMRSQSELSIKSKRNKKNCGTSVPDFRQSAIDISQKQQQREKIKNRFTITNSLKTETSMNKSAKRSRSLSRKCQEVQAQLDTPQKYALMKQITSNPDGSPVNKKNSALNLHWKRSWTLPLFTPKSVTVTRNALDTLDRQTYIYDDGTEVDSTAMKIKPNKRSVKGTESKCMPLMFFGGTLCAILLVSLVIWIIFGHSVFQPRVVNDGALKRYTKYISGGIIYMITSFFHTIGRILVIPAQNVHQNPPPWPVNPPYLEAN